MIWLYIIGFVVIIGLLIILWRWASVTEKIVLNTKTVLKVTIAALLLYILYRLREVFYLILIYPWFVDRLIELGVNLWLARAIVIAFLVPVIYVIKLLFSKDKVKKKIGYVVASVIAILYCLGMYYAQRDYAFDKMTGKAIVCFATTPYGVEQVPCEWKFHPIWNSKVEPADPLRVKSQIFKKKGYPKIERLNPTPDMQFFDTITGEPLVWYYQSPDGKIEIFDYSGYHPQYGVVLVPVSPAIVQEILKQIQSSQEAQNRIIIHETPSSTQEVNSSPNKKYPTFEGLQKLSNDLKNLFPK